MSPKLDSAVELSWEFSSVITSAQSLLSSVETVQVSMVSAMVMQTLEGIQVTSWLPVLVMGVRKSEINL